MRGLIIGAAAGLLVTVLLALFLPRRWGHLQRAVLAALTGGLVALALSEALP
ncbi:MAG: hypothetical protein DIU70_007605 [Bacillota bacterium]